MIAIKFSQANQVYGLDQPQYNPLYAYKKPQDQDGTVVSCWRMNWKERLKVLFTGKCYCTLLTFGNPIQPQRLSVDFHK